MMKAIPLKQSFVFYLLFFTTICHGADPLPARYVEKIETMPDFCQGDERYGAMPQHGVELCGPTALSNAVVWLSQHGFPKLLPHHKGLPADQSELIRRLSKGDFLSTDEKTGTSPKHIVTGIENFLKANGYDCHIEQMGWRSSVHRLGVVPDEHWMLRSCMGSSNVLVNVGWYKRHETKYVRDDGHWVTLVGFSEKEGRRVLYIHDPAIGAGIQKHTDECHLIPLPKHHTLGLPNGEPVNSDGFFELRGIHLKKGADLAIIDGAVAFQPVNKAP